MVANRIAVASTFWARFRGLMGRRALGPGEGLFLADNSIHMFFMRFAIDAVFVQGNDAGDGWTVVGLRAALRPWRGLVMPVRGAAAVFELEAGTIARTGLAVGDRLALETAEPRPA